MSAFSADANLAALLYVEEATWGETPATPTMQFLRFTGESLHQETQATQSNEIESSRNIQDVIRTGINAAGDINMEFSASTYDDFIEATLLSTWTSAIAGTNANVTFANVSSNVFSITRASGNWVSDGFTQYGWAQVANAANAANNGIFRIESVSTTVLTLRGSDGASESTNIPAIAVTQGAQVTNGTTFTSFTIEKRYTDLASEFANYTGMAPDTHQLTVTKDGLLTGSFGFLGKKELSTTATLANATSARTTTPVMNCIDHVTAVQEGTTYATYGVTDLSYSLNNNLRARLQVGTLGAVSVGKGSFVATGAHQAYYKTKAVMDKYLAMSRSSLAFIMNDGAGKKYVVEFPSVKYTSGQRVAGGINTDIFAAMNWQAYKDATQGITMRIVRFAS